MGTPAAKKAAKKIEGVFASENEPDSVRPAHRKAEADRKATQIHIRVTEDQKATLTAAAKKAGIGVSTWMLTTSLEAAEQKLAAKKPADGE